MTSQSDVLEQIKESEHRLDPFVVQSMSHPSWVSQHPSGFGSVSRVEEGNIFFVDPATVFATIQGWPPAHAYQYVDSIVRWWERSTLLFTMMLDPVTVILTFSLEEPLAFAFFLTHPDVVSGRYDLIDWLCPERRIA